MSLFGNGPQLRDNSDPLIVSSVNSSDVADISEFDPVRGGTFESVKKCIGLDLQRIPLGMNYLIVDETLLQKIHQKY